MNLKERKSVLERRTEITEIWLRSPSDHADAIAERSVRPTVPSLGERIRESLAKKLNAIREQREEINRAFHLSQIQESSTRVRQF
jgi:hypothetical protein